MTIPLRQEGTEEMTKGIPQGIKAQRKRDLPSPRSRPLSRSWRGSWGCCGSMSALPWALRLESWGRRQDQAPGGRCWVITWTPNTGTRLEQHFSRHPGTGSPHSGEGRQAYTTGISGGGLCPRSSQRIPCPHWALRPEGRPPWAYLSLTARYSKAWLIQRTAGVFRLT